MKYGAILALAAVVAFGAAQDVRAAESAVQSFQIAQAEHADEHSNSSDSRAARERRVQHMEEVMTRRQERGSMPDGFGDIDWTNSADLTLEEREERIDNVLTRGRGRPE